MYTHQITKTIGCAKNWVLLLPLLALLPGCSDEQSKQMQRPPVEVSVSTVSTGEMPVYSELPGRVVAPREAEVRARVTGVVQKQYFVEGSTVNAGDLLFLIDPKPSQAAYNRAMADLNKAEAVLEQTQQKYDRYQELESIGAVSQQDFDDLTADLASEKADVEVAKAALETASLDLGYTKVTAPISGTIGKAMVTEGALVSGSELTEMAVIRQMNPVYFDFTQSNADMLKLRKSIDSGKLTDIGEDGRKIQLYLEDGSVYGYEGKLLFSESSVDEDTGMVLMRAEFPNANAMLLPGSFARIRISQAVNKKTVLVPQQAVQRNNDGSAVVLVVGDDNKVETRTIYTGDSSGHDWVVTSGLNAGDKVIMEGLQKVKDGQSVTTVPFMEVKTANASDQSQYSNLN
jgi:membrane fusion protein (multidrug efflux system)